MGGERLGRVKVDIHQGEREFHVASLGNFESIKGLLVLRYKLDIYNDYLEQKDVLSCSDWDRVQQELICLYADIDVLIATSGLREGQKALLEMLRCGFTIEDVAEYRGLEVKMLNRELNKICRAIVDCYKTQWRTCMYFNYIRTEWKECRACGKSYPLSDSFYYRREDSTDGLRGECLSCQKSYERDKYDISERKRANNAF